jgi:C_GCAxxG_C_C family probable redox protein
MKRKQTVERSIDLFNSGYGCAESVLMAVSESKGIQSDLIPRIATGFCGGIAYSGGVCGAVTGAIMALNLIYGRDLADQSKNKNYEAVQLFLDAFRDRFGEIHCPALTGIDLSTDEGRTRFKEANLHAHCSEFVGEATGMVYNLTGL